MYRRKEKRGEERDTEEKGTEMRHFDVWLQQAGNPSPGRPWPSGTRGKTEEESGSKREEEKKRGEERKSTWKGKGEDSRVSGTHTPADGQTAVPAHAICFLYLFFFLALLFFSSPPRTTLLPVLCPVKEERLCSSSSSWSARRAPSLQPWGSQAACRAVGD